jgi:hypothetical protein
VEALLARSLVVEQVWLIGFEEHRSYMTSAVRAGGHAGAYVHAGRDTWAEVLNNTGHAGRQQRSSQPQPEVQMAPECLSNTVASVQTSAICRCIHTSTCPPETSIQAIARPSILDCMYTIVARACSTDPGPCPGPPATNAKARLLRSDKLFCVPTLILTSLNSGQWCVLPDEFSRLSSHQCFQHSLHVRVCDIAGARDCYHLGVRSRYSLRVRADVCSNIWSPCDGIDREWGVHLSDTKFRSAHTPDRADATVLHLGRGCRWCSLTCPLT